MPFSLPLYRVSGADYEEVGYRVGVAARARIQAAHHRRREWVDRLLAFIAEDRRRRLEPFLAATREETPHLLDELKGLARGAEVPFERLFAVFINPELAAMMKAAAPAAESCTTLAVVGAGKLWIAHNEDGAAAYQDLMYLLEADYPSGTRVLALTYPGYLPGNGPSLNSHGLAQTVNFIGATAVRPGLPRYAIDRAIAEAKTIDQAVALATHPRRAYSEHHLLLSTPEGRMVSVEAGADAASVLPVRCLYAHANHYLHPATRDLPQFSKFPGVSKARQLAAETWLARPGDPAAIGFDDLRSALAHHEDGLGSLCRHPHADLSVTLGAAIIQADEKTVSIHDGLPCRGLRQTLPWPTRP